ncbi:SDR family NAD(P)-dependent oxidoreductase [Enemella sp. A6]|uniref:SDR family NAD(P)-dependent oxidoreductase n=1 Tax=Enemella sp. A6 TaxID=3440152 RepID=UPI003EBA8CC1
MELSDKVAIVTGGAAGIGGAITRILVQRGAKVVFVDLSAEDGNSLAAELGAERAIFLHGDVSDRAIADRAVALAVEKFGRLTSLVNNAHASRQKPFIEHTREDWELSFGTGFGATVNFMQAAYPELRKQGGSVVNFGSGAGMEGQATQASYGAAKEAIRGLTRTVAIEWGPDDIRVNVVCPRALTPGVERWRDNYPEMYEASLKPVPLGRYGDPDTDVAPIVAFLISDDSRYMTAQTVMADGGGQKLR